MDSALVLAFGLVLAIAVLLSERARRTVLSTSVLFLVAGFALGGGGLGWLQVDRDGGLVQRFAELALFAILFVDGAGLPVQQLATAWRLPGRALLVGLPLTIGGIALAGRLLLGFGWAEAFLVGAILSPTDPVFVAAILEHQAVPLKLRRLLGIESGLNDGIALPVVMALLGIVGHRRLHLSEAVAEAGLGLAAGVAVPAAFLWLERRRFLGAAERYRPLGGVAVAATLLGLSSFLHLNEYLAAFAGGVCVASITPGLAAELRKLGQPLTEALKLAALLVFGATLRWEWLVAEGWRGPAFAALALLAARPLALVLALFRGGLARREWLAAAWFGPKGFASLFYALLMIAARVPHANRLFDVVALVIVVSIVAHSSTDTVIARTFRSGAKPIPPARSRS
jgi:NhaP-type Na+/H+ or K+/H+ antiporter